jgi:hypothetical protein
MQSVRVTVEQPARSALGLLRAPRRRTMNTTATFGNGAALALGTALTLAATAAACSNGASGQPSLDAGTQVDAQLPDAGAGDTADGPRARTLTLSLDPSLDPPTDGDVKAQTIASAVLLDAKGATAAMATIAGGAAVFDLGSVTPGDYFLKINGDADDLVPTRIDPSTDDVVQRVGQKLRASYIGPAANPTYRINTYSTGQQKALVVQFSDGGALAGEQPYVLFTFASGRLEIGLLGTGASIGSLTLSGCPGHGDVPADAWLLNTTNQDHHGDVFNADGGADNCGSCHFSYWRKKPSFADVQPAGGWCFRCHYGPDGTSAGFVDGTK